MKLPLCRRELHLCRVVAGAALMLDAIEYADFHGEAINVVTKVECVQRDNIFYWTNRNS